MARAIGITRISVTAGRKGDSFHSPTIQRDRIRTACKSEGFDLIEIHEELDVSGGRPLIERPGLLAAVEAIEAGEAEVVVAAYMDRLTRSMKVREEVIERVEAAGGTVLAVDMGVQSNATASQWLTGTLGSAVSEFIRRTAAERSAVAQQRAIDRGIVPWGAVTPGYRREVVGTRTNGARMWGPLIPDTKTAPIIRQAFEARARGATLESVRTFLAEHGVERSYHGVQSLMTSRVVLGEIHFGSYEPNLKAHEPIVDRDIWNQVQGVIAIRGPKAKSNRLLARLDVLFCGTCGGRMSVGTVRDGSYPFYRCSPTGDCSRRFTISARIVEGYVIDTLKARYADLDAHAPADRGAIEDRSAAERAQANLDTAIRAFDGLGDERSARERLAELSRIRDEAEERAGHSGRLRSSLVLNLADDWERLSMEAQRAIVAANFEAIFVGPGKGRDRLTVSLIG